MMRLSPVLLAVLTATASLGLAEPSRGQTPPSVPETSEVSPEREEPSPGTASPESAPEAPSHVVRTEAEIAAENSEVSETDSPRVDLAQEVPAEEDTEPSPPVTPPQNQPQPEVEADEEPRVLVAEVLIQGLEERPQLEDEVFNAIETRPGQATTRSQLQEDVNAIFETGFFSNVDVVPEDTPLGVRITFIVEPNPILQRVVVETEPPTAEQVLPQEVIDDAFSNQYGQTLNLRELQEGIEEINAWYDENGYDLAQVIDAQQATEEGVVTLVVAEGVIEDILVRYLDEEGDPIENEQGEPVILSAEDEAIGGLTRPFIITREMQLDPGDVFRRNVAERDLRRVFGLGIFEDVRLSFAPGSDPRKVDVVVDVIEGNTGSLAAGAGISSASGLFGSVSYQERNLGGNNQTLAAELQVGVRALLFDVRFTDPWIAGDPFRTSYTVNAFRRRSISLIFDGGENEVELPNGDRPRVLRTGGGINFTRPLSDNPYEDAEWTASAGFQYQRVSIRDDDGDISPEDELGNDLSFSGDGTDDLFTLQAAAVRDRRNSRLQPTSGSFLRLGVEQSIPIGSGSIFFNRVRGSYSYYLPVDFTNFVDFEDPAQDTETLALNLQGGAVFGDLPPYEAFSLGGVNSVRGYDEGDVGAGRYFVQATAEYRFPVFSFISGALFVDFASDLGSGDDVPGEPAEVRDKPGTGFGYGIGVRVQSPLGPIRVDYGFNDEGDSRLHFGIGERF
jgi:outer membrane protein insertion porin family